MLDALKPVNKAIAGAIAAGIVSFLMKNNIIVADQLPDALEVVISTVIGGLIVWLAPKNRPATKETLRG